MSTEALFPFVQAQDAKGFLKTYLELIVEGTNLPIPSHLQLAQIQEGWLEILPEICGGYTDEFVLAVSQTWLQVIKKQGGTITKTFAQDCLVILTTGGAKPAQPKVTLHRPSEGVQNQVPAISQATPDEGVRIQISDAYYQADVKKPTPPVPDLPPETPKSNSLLDRFKKWVSGK